jgi:hypothetical protein
MAKSYQKIRLAIYRQKDTLHILFGKSINNPYFKECIMDIDLKLNGNNLYKEESFTDLKTGAVRRLSPVKEDGSKDETREPIFMAQTQLMSPNGPLPVSCMIEATTLSEAVKMFPDVVQKEVERIVELAQKAQQEESSRIIVPGQG